MKTGIKLSVGMLPTLALLAGCATSQRLAVVSWDQLVAQSAGVPQRWNDYAPANVKIVESLDAGDSIEASKSKFRASCSAHGGVSSPTSQPARIRPGWFWRIRASRPRPQRNARPTQLWSPSSWTTTNSRVNGVFGTNVRRPVSGLRRPRAVIGNGGTTTRVTR